MMDCFTAGVVEGFYGVPWTADQRKILFSWMQKMGLNTYMYAPKDDSKHRAYWRELYSVEEAENLTSLIESAEEKGVSFVYAISPGLDITFSNAKDLQALKRKLEQVAAFGCRAFAILFDDIDPELSEADQGAFSSSACAQVSVTNELFEHLSQPKFFFCPTEYCASRALPTVSSSDYLKTLGAKLLPGIDIMWTGCKVVSKKITIQTLQDISAVLKRAPVIWDNIHANDYDPRRVFLGPYDGRSPEIIPYIRGVMTNPNCEFEANYIACHTLGQWCRSNPDGVKKDIISSESPNPVAADIKLEVESDFGSDEDLPSLDCRYKPRLALKAAMSEWLSELTSKRDPPKRKPPPSTGVSLPPGVPGSPLLNSVAEALPCCDSSLDLGIELSPIDNPPFLQPVAQLETVSSLSADSAADVSDSVSDSVSDCSSDVEPMECVPSSGVPIASNLNVLKEEQIIPSSVESNCVDTVMQIEDACLECETTQFVPIVIPPSLVCQEDVALLVDLFYLPFEHGSSSLQLLHSLQWLMSNAEPLLGHEETSKGVEWKQRLQEFEEKVRLLDVLLMRLFVGPNKSVLCDLYAYLWDLKGVLGICLAFVKWIELGIACGHVPVSSTGSTTWFSKGYKEAFSSGDQEPWIFRGGLQSELQRLLPMYMAHDLFLTKTPDWVVQRLYNFRSYNQLDKTAVYSVCLKTCDDGMDGSDLFLEFPDLLGDRMIGNFLACSPEFCFVVEDDEGVCGYVMAARDAQDLVSKSNQAWVSSMHHKYPKPSKEGQLNPPEETMMSFYTEPLEVREEVLVSCPSVLRLDVVMSRMQDPAIPRRLLACALNALKSAGSKGVHTKLNKSDKFMMDFYAKLGFCIPSASTTKPDNVVYMERLL